MVLPLGAARPTEPPTLFPTDVSGTIGAVVIAGHDGTLDPPAEPDFFVDATNGNDVNNGTAGNPWKTIGKVNAQTFSPGDLIAFKRGETWTDAVLNPPSFGSSESPITFGSYGTGANPVLDGQNTHNCTSPKKDFVTFEDLDLNNASSWGARVQADDVALNRCNVDSAGLDGVRFEGANGVLDGGRLSNNGNHGINFQSGGNNTTCKNFESDNNGEDGVQWNSGSGDNNTLDNANLHDNAENAVDFKNGTGHKITNSTLKSSAEDCVLIQGATTGLTLEDNDIEHTGTKRVLMVQKLQGTTAIVSRRNRYRGSSLTDNTVKLHNAPNGGSLDWTSEADIFDDENKAGTWQVRLRNACTALFDNCTFYKRHATGGNLQAAANSVLTVRNSGFRSNGGAECIDMGSGVTKTISNNGYHRTDSGNVVDDNGTTYTEGTVTSFDAAAQTGSPDLANQSDLSADYMRPNAASPWRSNGDDGEGPANDNNDEAYDSPNKNIGAVKGQA